MSKRILTNMIIYNLIFLRKIFKFFLLNVLVLFRPLQTPCSRGWKKLYPNNPHKRFSQWYQRIIEKKPAIKYVFAVDKTKNKTLKSVIKSISKSVGNASSFVKISHFGK